MMAAVRGLLPILLAIVTIVLPQALYAQRPVIRPLALPRLVANQPVQALAQDSTGMLWVGIPQGLVAYNGVDAPRLYNKADGLVEDAITALHVDKSGRLWIGHRSGAISLRERNRFKAFRPPEGVPAKQITKFISHPNGEIWFGTYGEGVYRWDGKRLHNLGISADTADAKAGASDANAADEEADALLAETGDGATVATDGLTAEADANLNVYCLAVDRKGRVWTGTDAGIIRYSPAGKDHWTSDARGMRQGLPDNLVQDIAFASDGTPWLALRDSGLCRTDLEATRFRTIKGWQYGSLSRLQATPDGILWCGTDAQGLVGYDLIRQSFQTISATEGLASNRVLALHLDAQGTLWIGTNSGATNLLGRRFAFIGKTEGLLSEHVFSVLKDRRGYYWVGTDSGLTRLSAGSNGRLQARTTLRYNGRTDEGRNAANINALAEGQDGTIWAGTFYGLYKVDPYTLQATRVPVVQPRTGVLSIATGKNGSLWLAAVGVGLVQVDNPASANPGFRVLGAAQGLKSNYLYHVLMDRSQQVWVATDGAGIARWNGRKFEHFGEAQGLPSRTVFSIKQDNEGRMYVLTADKGIFRMEKSRFTPLIGGDNSSFSLVTLVLTQNGNLVAAAEGNIRRIDPKEQLTREYGEEDGLANFIPNQNAAFRDNTGLIWIGSNRGLIMYDPASQSPRDIPPPVAITQQRIGTRDTILPALVELDSDENNLTFYFSAIELARPRKVLYQFKLVGYDADWSIPTSARFTTYQNLPPGDYDFQVRAAVNPGEWSITPASFPYVIDPPIWLTWWFLTLSALIVAGGIVVGVRARIRAVERQNRELEQKVQERTQEVVTKSQELQVAFDEIERKNSDITESILYARRIQSAILPEAERIRMTLADSFVYFRPKDIVSGDFYWYDSNPEHDLAMIAACDCTGHGVPGAFMSVISYALLNQIQHETRESHPDRILHQLDDLLRTSLKQNMHGAETKDGLDLALCVVDRKLRRVHFAGAMRPLYYIRDGEIHELKGSRFPIGGGFYADKHFTSEHIDVLDGDVFYLFSDGVVDQFGGPNGRKYTPKRLKELLRQIHTWPMEQQMEHVHAEFTAWQGSTDQLDDQLLIGFRL